MRGSLRRSFRKTEAAGLVTAKLAADGRLLGHDLPHEFEQDSIAICQISTMTTIKLLSGIVIATADSRFEAALTEDDRVLLAIPLLEALRSHIISVSSRSSWGGWPFHKQRTSCRRNPLTLTDLHAGERQRNVADGSA